MLSDAVMHRRFLHQIPELGEPFFQTLTLVSGVLRGHRCRYFSPMSGCLCAWFDFGREETTAFRAVLDGVPVQEAAGMPYPSRTPGCSHALARDGETAMALELCQWLAEQSDLPRNVLVIFQPQAGDGAKLLCVSDLFAQYHVTRLFGLRLWPGVPVGTAVSRPGALMARSNEITVRIEGRAAHFSRAEEGRDALLAAAEFLHRSRAVLDGITKPSLLRFGKLVSGLNRFTVSPEAVLEGCLLTYREEAFEAMRTGLKRAAREVEAETGCAFDVRLSEGWPAVWNDEAFYASVCAALGADAPGELAAPTLESDDFSVFQRYVPALLFFLGIGKGPELRSPAFNFDEKSVLPAGVEYLKKLARLN